MKVSTETGVYSISYKKKKINCGKEDSLEHFFREIEKFVAWIFVADAKGVRLR